MSFGIQIKGSHGDIVVDTSFRNLLKIGEGSSSAPITDLVLPSQGSSIPQVFIRPWADEHYVGAFELFGSTVRIRTNRFIRSGTFGVIDTGAGFDWIAFGINGVSPIDGSTHGLQVFDSSANRIYDSRYECPLIQSVLLVGPSGQSVTNQQWPQSYSFSGWGVRPWICLNTFSIAPGSEDGADHYYVTTTGTSTIKIRQARVADVSSSNVAISFVDNNFSGVAVSFPGQLADVPLLRRYNE